MRRKRRNHSSAFKAEVALAAVTDDRMLAELAQQFDVHANQIAAWKRQLVDGARATFDHGTAASDSDVHVAESHAKTRVSRFLERGLARFETKRGGP